MPIQHKCKAVLRTFFHRGEEQETHIQQDTSDRLTKEAKRRERYTNHRQVTNPTDNTVAAQTCSVCVRQNCFSFICHCVYFRFVLGTISVIQHVCFSSRSRAWRKITVERHHSVRGAIWWYETLHLNYHSKISELLVTTCWYLIRFCFVALVINEDRNKLAFATCWYASFHCHSKIYACHLKI